MYFWMNKLQFMCWSHFSDKVKQHPDMESTLCMFGEKNKVMDVEFRPSMLATNGRMFQVEFSNCNAISLVKNDDDDDDETFYLKAQTKLMGREDVFLAQVALREVLNAVDARLDQKSKNSKIYVQTRYEYIKEEIVESLWKQSSLVQHSRSQIIEGLKSYLHVEGRSTVNITKSDYIHIQGLGSRLENQVDFKKTRMTVTKEAIICQNDESVPLIDEINKVPVELQQHYERNSVMCSFLSALLVIRSRNRIIGRDMMESVGSSFSVDYLSNLGFFPTSDDMRSLHVVLQSFGYMLKKTRAMNVMDVFETLDNESLYLCGIQNHIGMHHCVAIDASRKVIWDPWCSHSKDLSPEFFRHELCVDEKEDAIQLVELNQEKKSNNIFSTWIDSAVVATNDQALYKVIYVDYTNFDDTGNKEISFLVKNVENGELRKMMKKDLKKLK